MADGSPSAERQPATAQHIPNLVTCRRGRLDDHLLQRGCPRRGVEAWPIGTRAVYTRIAERIEVFGPSLGMPYTRALGGGLFEIRADGHGGAGRALFCTAVGEVRTWSSRADGRKRYNVKTHEEMVESWKADPDFRRHYDGLEEELALLDELLRARRRAGLTQAEVAARMGTRAPAVARLEAGGGRKAHSPSVGTLKRYADAVGCKLEIRLVDR